MQRGAPGAHGPFPSPQNLKEVLANMIPKEQARIKSFRQQHGSTAIGQITVDMVSGAAPRPPPGPPGRAAAGDRPPPPSPRCTAA